MFEYISANEVVFVEANPAWVKNGMTCKSLGPILSPLLRFFVVETPAPGLSNRSVSVSEYGWGAPWRKPQYLNKKLKAASSNKSLYWSAAAVGDMEQALRNADLLIALASSQSPSSLLSFMMPKAIKRSVCFITYEMDLLTADSVHLSQRAIYGSLSRMLRENERMTRQVTSKDSLQEF